MSTRRRLLVRSHRLSQDTILVMHGRSPSRSWCAAHLSGSAGARVFLLDRHSFRAVCVLWISRVVVYEKERSCARVSAYCLRCGCSCLMSGLRTIRLPDQRMASFPDSGPLATLASVPYFVLGLAGIAWEYVSSRSPQFRSRRGYRTVPVDEDAQVLRFEDEE